MAAYMMIAAKIKDREKFITGYGQEAGKLVTKFGGEYVFVAPGATLLEGSLEGYTSVALSRWPSKADALAFWHSEEYAQVKELRDGIADVEVIVVETP